MENAQSNYSKRKVKQKWLQNPSQTKRNHLKNFRYETIRHMRNKMEISNRKN